MANLEEFKALLSEDVKKASACLREWEKALRVPVTDSHDHQAAHDEWQALFEAERLYCEKTSPENPDAGSPATLIVEPALAVLPDPFKAPPAGKKKSSGG